MNTTLTRRRFAALLSAAGCISLQSAALAEEAKWTDLFNGKDLTGWNVPTPNPWWTVSEGVLIGTNDDAKKGNMLYTSASYGDFELEGEAKWQGEIDSGFMVRKPEIQLQIGVSRSLKKDMTGSFYTGKYPEEGQAKDAATLVKFGDWNKFRLLAKGDTFTVWINGTKAVEYKNAKYAGPGPIGLQIHGGVAMKIEFRNLRVRVVE